MVFNSSMNTCDTFSILSEPNFMVHTIQLVISLVGITYFFCIFLNSNFDKKKSKKILGVINDANEDLDDEIALGKMLDKMKTDEFDYTTVYIIFANGANETKISSNKRKEVFLKLFTEIDSDNFYINNTEVHLITMDVIDNIKGVNFDVLLQIAPLCGMGTNFFTSNTFQRRVVMGDLTNPNNSLNLSKSWNDKSPNKAILDKEFNDQQKILSEVPSHYITTSLSRNVPFTYNMITKLPESFQVYIFNKAFKQLVERVPPNLSYCQNVTIGANLPTAKAYLRGWDDKNFEEYYNNISDNVRNIINKQVTEFMVFNNNDIFRKALRDIYLVVYYITDSIYISSDFSVKNLENSEEAKIKFLDFIKNNKSNLTPAYDLLAMHIVLENMYDVEVYDETFQDELTKELDYFYG
tara:strand:- start:1647 stop:2873 length:1227 start_codon:yes stop_codon:yes gene_type:complete